MQGKAYAPEGAVYLGMLRPPGGMALTQNPGGAFVIDSEVGAPCLLRNVPPSLSFDARVYPAVPQMQGCESLS